MRNNIQKTFSFSRNTHIHSRHFSAKYPREVFFLRNLLKGQFLLAVERNDQSCNCPKSLPISSRNNCVL
jgi:hypothetical protein